MLSYKQKKLQAIIGFFCVLAPFSCTYQFSNYAYKPPKGISKIAVEAVYDTSRSVIPHDILWDEIQVALARSGHLVLTSIDNAEGLLRVHIKNYSTRQFGRSSTINEFKDPRPFETGEPTPPRYLRNLAQSHSIAQQETFTLGIDVELWDLHTQKKVFSKSYSTQKKYKIGLTQNKKLIHLRSEESNSINFAAASEDLANRIASDLLGR